MPGLFGIIRLQGSAPAWSHLEQLFERMAIRLHHLPAYRIDRWQDPRSGCAIGRIGLPFHHAADWDQLLHPGQEPVRVFLAGHEHGGTAALTSAAAASLNSLRGFFAVALQGPTGITLGVDRRASTPIFYAEAGNLLLFAPEIKALLACGELARDIDLGALGSMLVGGHMLGGATLLEKVRRLRGGEALQIQDGKVTRHAYWTFAPGSRIGPASDRELEEELADVVRRGMARNLGTAAKTVISLSGGYDSRSVLGAALDTVGGDGRRLHSMSWGDNEGPPLSDAAIAAQLAAAVGLQHQFFRRTNDRYATDFPRVNYLMDSVSDIAANHASQFPMMEALRAQGLQRMLRGDHVFGWNFPPADIDQALSLMRLRRVQDCDGLLPFVQPRYRQGLLDASNAGIEAAALEIRDMHPTDAKDFLHFSHRIQNYLQTAGYYKQVALDHRNVLLDEEILDFVIKIPHRLRIHKKLLRDGMARAYPELWRFPMATHDNIENWEVVLGSDTPVRAYALEQLADATSGVWEYFDRQAIRAALDTLIERVAHKRTEAFTLRRRARAAWKACVGVLPKTLTDHFRHQRRGKASFRLTTENLIFRVLVLKHFHDALLAERRQTQAA